MISRDQLSEIFVLVEVNLSTKSALNDAPALLHSQVNCQALLTVTLWQLILLNFTALTNCLSNFGLFKKNSVDTLK